MAVITPIIKPFCNSGTQVALPVNTNTLTANQETGFPDSQATPFPTGTPVRQDQINGALKLYTNLLFQQGQGLQYTFDDDLATAIGGYDLGAILYCESNNTFQQSLVSVNLANFVSNPSFINDGIHWQTMGGKNTNTTDTYLSAGIAANFNVSINGQLSGTNSYNIVVSGTVEFPLTATNTTASIPLSAIGLSEVRLLSLGSMSKTTITPTFYQLAGEVSVSTAGTTIDFVAHAASTPPADTVGWGFVISFAASLA